MPDCVTCVSAVVALQMYFDRLSEADLTSLDGSSPLPRRQELGAEAGAAKHVSVTDARVLMQEGWPH